MLDLTKAKHQKISEKVVETLINKTQNNNPLFFRVLVAFYFTKVASMMRCNIKTHDRGIIPVNLYAINLAPSGTGKTFSSNILEEEVINKFKSIFLKATFPVLAENNIIKIANERASKYAEDPDLMLEKTQKEFSELGPLLFSFDSGTSPALKQMRQKLLMATAGSANLVVDEIGSNLVSNTEILNTFLELYDVGKVRQKLVKNTSDNKRSEEIEGRTPANMMLYGTPSKLLNGSKTEDEFYSMLDIGYARRCIFGYAKKVKKLGNLTAQEVYDKLTDSSNDKFLEDLSDSLGDLGKIQNFDINLTMSKDVALLFIEYRLFCEQLAEEYREHEEIAKAEMCHRYYKTLKLAGAYAFIENKIEIEEEDFYAAVALVEESGKAFREILAREKNYIKLAKYIASINKEITQVDLVEDLPFYRGSESQKKELINLATAYGYKNSIIIHKSYIDNIEFFKGETLEKTNLDEVIISHSQDLAVDYEEALAPFSKLHQLTTLDNFHYTAHHFREGHRSKDKVKEGFNLVILDVDEGITLKAAKELLKGYTALFCTTKRHTEQHNRFRIIMPISHIVKLSPEKYTAFMQNIYEWLPFKIDDQTQDIARKWESYNGEYHYQIGKLLDVMIFIPETKKQEEQSKKQIDSGSLNNLERWFLLNTDTGNRSNQLIKYAYVLVDMGQSMTECRANILDFNKKLKTPLPEPEIDKTIMASVMKAIAKKEN